MTPEDYERRMREEGIKRGALEPDGQFVDLGAAGKGKELEVFHRAIGPRLLSEHVNNLSKVRRQVARDR